MCPLLSLCGGVIGGWIGETRKSVRLGLVGGLMGAVGGFSLLALTCFDWPLDWHPLEVTYDVSGIVAGTAAGGLSAGLVLRGRTRN